MYGLFVQCPPKCAKPAREKKLYNAQDNTDTMYFLATTPIMRQFDAMWELEWALGEDVKVKKTQYPGLLIASIDMDRNKALESVRDYETTALYKVFPIDAMIKTDKDAIYEKAMELAKEMIGADDTFAVRVRKRGGALPSSKDTERELGAMIVEQIGAKVNLDYPQKTLKIEVIGRRTGISVLGPDDIVSKEVEEF